MPETPTLAQYLSHETHLPEEDVIGIYRAGAPWPILFKEWERLAARDAEATGVPLETARHALAALLNLEGAHLIALTNTARVAAGPQPSLDHPDVQALVNHPIMERLVSYSERVALRMGAEDVSRVFAVYLALLGYAWAHPEWVADGSLA